MCECIYMCVCFGDGAVLAELLLPSFKESFLSDLYIGI